MITNQYKIKNLDKILAYKMYPCSASPSTSVRTSLNHHFAPNDFWRLLDRLNMFDVLKQNGENTGTFLFSVAAQWVFSAGPGAAIGNEYVQAKKPQKKTRNKKTHKYAVVAKLLLLICINLNWESLIRLVVSLAHPFCIINSCFTSAEIAGSLKTYDFCQSESRVKNVTLEAKT